MRHNLGIRLGIVLGQPVTPLEVADQSGPKLRVRGQSGVIGGETHQGGEPESLLGSDPEIAVIGEHALVAAEPFGVLGGPLDGPASFAGIRIVPAADE